MKINLSREDMMQAVSQGVKEAVIDMCDAVDMVRLDQFLEQIRQGTKQDMLMIKQSLKEKENDKKKEIYIMD